MPWWVTGLAEADRGTVASAAEVALYPAFQYAAAVSAWCTPRPVSPVLGVVVRCMAPDATSVVWTGGPHGDQGFKIEGAEFIRRAVSAPLRRPTPSMGK